jgi:hypothetical protein
MRASIRPGTGQTTVEAPVLFGPHDDLGFDERVQFEHVQLTIVMGEQRPTSEYNSYHFAAEGVRPIVGVNVREKTEEHKRPGHEHRARGCQRNAS